MKKLTCFLLTAFSFSITIVSLTQKASAQTQYKAVVGVIVDNDKGWKGSSSIVANPECHNMLVKLNDQISNITKTYGECEPMPLNLINHDKENYISKFEAYPNCKIDGLKIAVSAHISGSTCWATISGNIAVLQLQNGQLVSLVPAFKFGK